MAQLKPQSGTCTQCGDVTPVDELASNRKGLCFDCIAQDADNSAQEAVSGREPISVAPGHLAVMPHDFQQIMLGMKRAVVVELGLAVSVGETIRIHLRKTALIPPFIDCIVTHAQPIEVARMLEPVDDGKSTAGKVVEYYASTSVVLSIKRGVHW